MSTQNLSLSKDLSINGSVTYSQVSKAELATADLGREPVYMIEITPDDPSLAEDIGVLYGSMTGPNCLNGFELYQEFKATRTLCFETILKPGVTGVDSSGEFQVGQHVKVSCRLEYKEIHSAKENGFFCAPRLMLRFVDIFAPEVQTPKKKVEDEWKDETYYNF